MTVSPSLLAANFAQLQTELDRVAAAGADMLHLDVMDGHFVPNISFGMPVLASLRKITKLFFDVHIMISQPQRYIDALRDAGADLVNFHLEAEGDAGQTIDQIRAAGMQVGMTLKPGTPASAVLPYLDRLDLVLIMTVEPGFGGQKFMTDMMPKVREIADYARTNGLDKLTIQVDGGVARDTVATCAKAGATSFVAGSSVFGKPDYAAEIAALKALAAAEVA